MSARERGWIDGGGASLAAAAAEAVLCSARTASSSSSGRVVREASWQEAGISKEQPLAKDDVGPTSLGSHRVFLDLYEDAVNRIKRQQQRQSAQEAKDPGPLLRRGLSGCSPPPQQRSGPAARERRQRPCSLGRPPERPGAHLGREAGFLRHREEWRQRRAAWQERRESFKEMAECTFSPVLYTDEKQRAEAAAWSQWIEEERRCLEEFPDTPPGRRRHSHRRAEQRARRSSSSSGSSHRGQQRPQPQQPPPPPPSSSPPRLRLPAQQELWQWPEEQMPPQPQQPPQQQQQQLWPAPDTEADSSWELEELSEEAATPSRPPVQRQRSAASSLQAPPAESGAGAAALLAPPPPRPAGPPPPPPPPSAVGSSLALSVAQPSSAASTQPTLPPADAPLLGDGLLLPGGPAAAVPLGGRPEPEVLSPRLSLPAGALRQASRALSQPASWPVALVPSAPAPPAAAVCAGVEAAPPGGGAGQQSGGGRGPGGGCGGGCCGVRPPVPPLALAAVGAAGAPRTARQPWPPTPASPQAGPESAGSVPQADFRVLSPPVSWQVAGGSARTAAPAALGPTPPLPAQPPPLAGTPLPPGSVPVPLQGRLTMAPQPPRRCTVVATAASAAPPAAVTAAAAPLAAAAAPAAAAPAPQLLPATGLTQRPLSPCGGASVAVAGACPPAAGSGRGRSISPPMRRTAAAVATSAAVRDAGTAAATAVPGACPAPLAGAATPRMVSLPQPLKEAAPVTGVLTPHMGSPLLMTREAPVAGVMTPHMGSPRLATKDVASVAGVMTPRVGSPRLRTKALSAVDPATPRPGTPLGPAHRLPLVQSPLADRTNAYGTSVLAAGAATPGGGACAWGPPKVESKAAWGSALARSGLLVEQAACLAPLPL